jgi:enolase
MDVREQRKIDMTMIALDGTPNKGRLGANAILGVSLAVARAAANTSGLPLYRYINAMCHVIPAPLMNFINGGKLTANDLEIQEFIIIPVGAGSYGEALRITTEINEILRDLVIEKYGILATNTGFERRSMI